jgi:NADPH:quinone reductase-like Zn-dependent oxidoreductase
MANSLLKPLRVGLARRAALDELAQRFDTGVLTPRVGGTFPLSQAARAHLEAERPGHPRGDYVLQPAPAP